MAFEVITTNTSKEPGKPDEDPKTYRSNYEIFDQSKKSFTTLEEAKDYVDKTYGKARRQKIYNDAAGEGQQTGWVFTFKNADMSHPYNDDGSKNEWTQRDWIEIRETKISYPSLRKVPTLRKDGIVQRYKKKVN